MAFFRKDDDSAIKAKESEEAFEALVKTHKNFILKTAYQTAHHYVSESDDEWSVALIAFGEAVRTYDKSKGSFKGFAAMVIRRRLIDYYNKESKHQNEQAVGPDTLSAELTDNPSSVQLEVSSKISGEAMTVFRGSTQIKDEIEALSGVLAFYEISFFDLPAVSPKAGKTKNNCAIVIRTVLKDDGLLTYVREKRKLPIKEICKNCEVPRKILENHRKYIIAGIEILSGEYPLLAEYLKFVDKGQK